MGLTEHRSRQHANRRVANCSVLTCLTSSHCIIYITERVRFPGWNVVLETFVVDCATGPEVALGKMQHEPPRDGQTCTISHSVSNSGPLVLSNTDDVKDRRCARLLPNGPHKRSANCMP